MTINIATASRAAAQHSCVETLNGPLARGTDGPRFAPCARWTLLDLVTEVRRDLNLTANDISVLRALLSFLPVRSQNGIEAKVTPETQTVVFASNAAISARANGLDDRVLRHAFGRLIRAGLLHRRDSANGKRFPMKRGGKIVAAFGLDLAPAFASCPMLRDLALRNRAEAEQIRTLRSLLQARRRALLDRIDNLCDTVRDWLLALPGLLRRKLDRDTLDNLTQTFDTVERALLDVPMDKPASANPEAEGQTATDGRIYRHTECEKIESDKTAPPQIATSATQTTSAGATRPVAEAWKDCPELASYFPNPPRTETELRDILCRCASMLRISPDTLGRAVARLGWTATLPLFETLAKKALHLRNPDAYCREMLAAT